MSDRRYWIYGRVAVWRARLRDEMPHADGTANPLLWWAQDLDTRDHLVCGVPTKRECLREAGVKEH